MDTLALRIQRGETDLITALWLRVEWFVRWQARQYYGRLSAPHCQEEDLVQAGFEAIIYTLQMHDPEKGRFLTYLGHALHKAFAETAGLRRPRDAFFRCSSLDAPISAEDEDTVLADLVEDPRAGEAFDAVERRIYNEQLRDALEKALAQIDGQDADVLRGVYFDCKSLSDLAKDKDVSKERIRQRTAHGLRGLRHCKMTKELREYLDDRTPSRMGGTRPTEAAVEYREMLLRFRGIDI